MSAIQAFDFSINLLKHIIWQYDKTVNLYGLVSLKNTWFAQNGEQFWTDWYNDVFNLDTANDFGLCVWAIILDIPIFADDSSTALGDTFGFDPYYQNFTHGNFAPPRNGALLTTEERRVVLKLRYYQITTNGSVTAINAALNDVFGVGNAYVDDNYNMTIVYTFINPISAPLLNVLLNFDVMPRPAGVSATFSN